MNKLPKLLDCTLRDGGYINNWSFSLHFGQNLYQAVTEAGCDYVEVGFFEPGKTTGLPWTNLGAEDLRAIRSELGGGSALAVMINYGGVSLEDVPASCDYPADLIRVATPKSRAREATEFAAALSKKGYRTTVNYMGISNYSNGEVLSLLELMNAFKADVEYFYVADSFGSLLPKRTREIFTTLRFGTDAALGFHPHNNLQLAFANCLEAMEAGVDIIDGSVFGMGRGAGNLFTDAMLAYYEQQAPERYRLIPILQFADLYMQEMQRSYNWGYSLPQLLSGIFHCHPNYPTNLLREKAYTADDIYRMLRGLPETEKSRFSQAQLEAIKDHHLQHLAKAANVRISSSIRELCERSQGCALLVCGGRSVCEQRELIADFIRERRPSVFTVNNPDPPVPADGVFFGNRRRVLQYFDKIHPETEVILGPEINNNAETAFSLKKVSRVNSLHVIPKGAAQYPMSLPSNSAVEAILGLVQIGYKEIYICGLDGYTAGQPSHYYSEQDAVNLPEELEAQNRAIRLELSVTRRLEKSLGFTFSILTPTLFEEFQIS